MWCAQLTSVVIGSKFDKERGKINRGNIFLKLNINAINPLKWIRLYCIY